MFVSYESRLDYIQKCLVADSARLRLRDDRESRYAAAVDKLRKAKNDEAWLLPEKPKVRAEALKLLQGERDAFLHTVGKNVVMCFTKDSLIRCAGIEFGEYDDFVSKLKANHLLEHKTHPVTFANREQIRLTCVHAEGITVTASEHTGEV